MPVARSVSASQLARGEGSVTSPGTPEADSHLLTQKAHTLDRFCNPSAMNGHAEPRRKRPFMSFRLSKKTVGKQKEGDVSQNPSGGLIESQNILITENGAESLDGSDSSSASVKPKKKYLTRVSSFVSRVASKVQGGGGIPVGPGGIQKGRLERSKTISVSDLRGGPKPPEDYVEFEDGQVPGATGIRNHGNTCFINAVIQCLSHTDLLAEYFVLDQYKLDLARCNKINSKKYGTRGEITEQLAILLKALWTRRYLPDLSMNFKNTVDKYESIYRGSQQHDAAEFLMFVLDKVHEDLNTASKRKYKKIKNTYGRPDEVVAAETLANHLRCNSSFIHDIFQAQFRSSLKCPHCHKESNTFDPFLCVSIPIPQRQVLPVFVCVVYLNQQPKQVQLGMSLDAGASVKELRSQLAEDCGIASETLIITELDGEGFHRTFADASPVNVISESDPIYAIELPKPRLPTQDTGGALVLLTWINVVLAHPDNIRFGGVYQSQVVRDVSYPDLQKLLLKEMTTMVTTLTLTSHQQSGLFIIGVDDGGSCVVGLEVGLDVPLFHPCVEQALALCDPTAGPPHLKLVLQWSLEAKEKYIVDDVDHIDEHLSVRELRQNPHQCVSVSLHQCLQLHTSAEKLGCGDAWHCPTCNRKQQVVKRLMLWSAPQILVIHLKRFRQGTLQSNSSKLSTTVKFPLSGFDISEHVASKPNHNHNYNYHNNGGGGSFETGGVLGSVWSPWKRSKRQVTHTSDESVFDLYGVCYHHGKDMQGGHYTAMCKNTADNKWYSFDDSKVEVASESQVVSPDAYILFYQRRSEVTHLSSCSEGSVPDYWAYRIPLSYLPPALTPQVNKEVKAPAPFERGRSYGTLPVSGRGQRGSSSEREHCSDTEAPLAAHEESPVLKRRSTSTLPESDQYPPSPQEAPRPGLRVETVLVEVLSDGADGEDSGDMECEAPSSSGKDRDGDQEMTEEGGEALRNSTVTGEVPVEISRNNPVGGKTVLISRCQALKEQDLTGASNTTQSNGHTTDTGGSTDEETSHVPSLESQESSESRPEEEDEPETETPEVRIHPATPEVLAAHQGHANAQLTKRSVITLTLRPRNASESSAGSGCGGSEAGSRDSVIGGGREGHSSRLSSSSSSSLVGVAVNSSEEVYQNGHSEERENVATPEIRITPLVGKAGEIPTIIPPPVKVSTRCMNANKTASFVIINTPSASPRQPRPKTPMNGSYPGTSPRPYITKSATKSRDSSTESLKSQRSVCSRKENGVCGRKENGVSVRKENGVSARKENGVSGRKENGINGKHAMTNGKSQNPPTSLAYCGPIKNGVCPKPHRQDNKGEVRYCREDKHDREKFDRDVRYDREGKYDRDRNCEREGRYDRDIKYDRDRNYDREGKYDRDRHYEREGRYSKERNYEREGKYERDCRYDRKYDRESWYDRERHYEHPTKCERDSMYERDGTYERDCICERDGIYDRDGKKYNSDRKYPREARYERELSFENGIYDRERASERDYSFERDGWCEKEYEYNYEGEGKCARDLIYERDLEWRGEGRCDRECICDRRGAGSGGREGSNKSIDFESRDHYHAYPKGLPNTATNPTVITESSV